MFVAWRDMRFARGRFLLIGAVVTLITVLVGFLSGLTAGLAQQNISAITSLSADTIVFSQPKFGTPLSYADSAVNATQAAIWAKRPGVTDVQPLGISQGKATARTATNVALFGVDTGYRDIGPGETIVSEPAAKALGVDLGQSLTVGTITLKVIRTGGNDWYSHTPVIWLNRADWQAATPGNAFATVLLVKGQPAGADVPGTTTTDVWGSLTAIGAFRSEIGSLLTMVAMLFGISALVIGAFFTVWTIQRKADIAVLKALGASNRMLVRDALGQALVILVLGVGAGFALTAGLGALAGQALPFVLSPLTTLLPATALIALGLTGAAFALRTVTHTDPLTALGGNR